MLENIPAELRAIPHWVGANLSKEPINPRTGRLASPKDPSTGATFQEAIECGQPHIGFILSPLDPYAIIDLDNPFERQDKITKIKTPILPGDPDYAEACKIRDRHNRIFKAFPTYAELSQSGKGVHLVMRGKIPAGVRRDKVELYSDGRYMIFTGNILKHSPVNDCQELLSDLWGQIGRLVTITGELIEEDPIYTDDEIWDMALSSAIADKFRELCRGDWQGLGYPSQSEADFALLSYLCFFSRSNSQVVRMFRMTALGQRDKAKRDAYLISNYGVISKIRAKEPAQISLEGLRDVGTLQQADLPGMESIELQAPPVPSPTPTAPATVPAVPAVPAIGEAIPNGITFPPGLVGEIASYILSSSTRPVPEISLASAIALCAGIAGRTWNISGSGLNQYVIILAKTGRGKADAGAGINRLIRAVRETVPMAQRFIGPAAFASGPALRKLLVDRPCFVSIMGEIGHTLKNICNDRASSAEVALRRELLDLYAQSGHGQLLGESVYSNKENNALSVEAPNVTLLGESNPGTFFEALQLSNISEGLVPRFMVFDYQGKRVRRNKNARHKPAPELVQRLAKMVTNAINMGHNGTCQTVPIHEDAEALLDAFDEKTDDRINGSENDIEEEIWNRAHLKALKLAALVAVGVNPDNPVITLEIAEWCMTTIRREVSFMLARFDAGELGSIEAKQEMEIRRMFARFQQMDHKQRRTYRCPEGLLSKQVVPFQFLNIYSRRSKPFVEDRKGSSRALQDALALMVKTEQLAMIPLSTLTNEFNTRSPIYYPGPAWGG